MAGDERKLPRRAESDRVGLAALAVLVLGLAAIVWLAAPKDSDLRAAADGGGAEGEAVAADASGARTRGALERLPEASAELAVLTDKPEAEVARIASAEAIAKVLESRHCGGTCDALRKLMVSREHFEVEVTKSEDYILPAKDSYDTIAAGLTPGERATIGTRPLLVVIRTHGPSTIDQMPARLAFAATAVVAEALSGFVYDEAVRRIETAEQHVQRVITVPLGQNVFLPRHISVQLYRQEDGSARLLTLGMARFGSPDFTMRGSSMEAGPPLANVMNAAASWAAATKTELPIVVSLDDVARASAHRPDELTKNAKGSRPIALEAIDFDRTEGDPENEMLELVTSAGATREAWDSALGGLFGEVPKVVFARTDKELEAVAVKARRELPAAVKRFESGEGALFVKGPFPIPEASRLDGGAKDEWMWIDVASCDARSCSGTLSNTPGYATNLSAGKPVSVAREKTADWLLKLKDGGTAGGDSVKVLEKRAH
jgi:uncharacterized protein YegJ (DUF2314 family)